MTSPQREAAAQHAASSQREDLPRSEAQAERGSQPRRESQPRSEPQPRREAPPPLEGNDQLITVVITAAWALALIVLLSLGHNLPSSKHWWIWTCVTGVGLGLFAVVYVPFLKRSRARAAERRSGGGAT